MTQDAVPTTSTDPRIGMVLQDRYQILRKLGEGGMGSVYEGEHTLIKRRVAIKCLHSHYATVPDIVARFHREALAATSIGHPNIIECTDMGRFPDGAFFMVLELLEGRDWAHDQAKTGPQTLGRVVHVMTQVCDALTAAHGKGIIHRDLKPENIFLVARGDDPDFVKVLDFGISKIRGAEGDTEHRNLTHTGVAMGTPYFMAPEQAQGKKDVDQRADIYALGVMLFQALGGRYPFDDESYPMLMIKICMHDPPPLEALRPDLPPEVADLVRRMLAKQPDDRPRSCAEVKAALAPFRGHTQDPVVLKDVPVAAPLDPSSLAGAAKPASPQSAGTDAAPVNRTGPIEPQPETRPTPTPFVAGDAGPVARSSQAPAPSSARTGIVAAVIAAAIVIAVGVAYTQRGPEIAVAPAVEAATPVEAPPEPPSAPEPVAEVLEEAPAAPTVRVQISTLPDDAEVYLDDRRMPNPFDGDLPQTTAPRNLRVERAGYTTQVQDLVLEFAQRVVVRLHTGRGIDDRSTAHARPESATRHETPRVEHTTPDPVPEVRPDPVPAVEVHPDPPPEPEGERHAIKNPFAH